MDSECGWLRPTWFARVEPERARRWRSPGSHRRLRAAGVNTVLLRVDCRQRAGTGLRTGTYRVAPCGRPARGRWPPGMFCVQHRSGRCKRANERSNRRCPCRAWHTARDTVASSQNSRRGMPVLRATLFPLRQDSCLPGYRARSAPGW